MRYNLHRLAADKDFRTIYNHGRKLVTPYFLLFYHQPAKPEGLLLPRFGFVASKKVGGAVQRNRAKRLLREAVRPLLPQLKSDFEVVIVAFPSLLNAHLDAIKAEIRKALTKVTTLKSI